MTFANLKWLSDGMSYSCEALYVKIFPLTTKTLFRNMKWVGSDPVYIPGRCLDLLWKKKLDFEENDFESEALYLDIFPATIEMLFQNVKWVVNECFHISGKCLDLLKIIWTLEKKRCRRWFLHFLIFP